MKLVCLSFTEKGGRLGDRLEKLGSYNINHIRNSSMTNGIKSIMEELWNEYDGIIFISATGIASRFIAPFIEDKTKDPAIIVIDDEGKFVISLLSGHLGGANKITKDISREIGGRPVITTASDSRGFDSLDIFAQKNNYYMEDMKTITRLTSMMVNNKKIGFFTEDRQLINYPNIEILDSLEDIDKKKKDIEGLIIVSSKIIDGKKLRHIPYTILRPRNINIGIGCRKNVEGKRIREALETDLSTLGLARESIKAIGTIEIKKDEKGIIDTAKYYKLPLQIFTIEEIKKVEDKFKKSQFVKDTIGVYSVSEPVAYLLGGKVILSKSKHNGITISISKEEKNG